MYIGAADAFGLRSTVWFLEAAASNMAVPRAGGLAARRLGLLLAGTALLAVALWAPLPLEWKSVQGAAFAAIRGIAPTAVNSASRARGSASPSPLPPPPPDLTARCDAALVRLNYSGRNEAPSWTPVQLLPTLEHVLAVYDRAKEAPHIAFKVDELVIDDAWREVPKLLHFLYVHNQPDERYIENIRRCAAANPGWTVTFWIDKRWPLLDRLLDANVAIRNVTEIVARMSASTRAALQLALGPDGGVGVATDVLRYQLQHDHGGVYTDTDTYCRLPLDDVFACPFLSIRKDEPADFRYLWGAFGLPPRSGFARYMIDTVGQHVRHVQELPHKRTIIPTTFKAVQAGPIFLTRAAVQYAHALRARNATWALRVLTDEITTVGDHPPVCYMYQSLDSRWSKPAS